MKYDVADIENPLALGKWSQKVRLGFKDVLTSQPTTQQLQILLAHEIRGDISSLGKSLIRLVEVYFSALSPLCGIYGECLDT